MKTIMSRNDLFQIVLVEDTEYGTTPPYYELIETPNTTIQTFDSYSLAEQVMQQKTEFWRTLIRKLYFEAHFIA